ncbi:unnamed protein product [Moneuplotes crassus]|uniref:AP2/ERF domain-containing protein n=1 Tax=Euplotes crassus TaxID=5936 RepID=A0AAD1U023_EUPCR|nr:unnamed protein product [Moneuplotes crassus]
MDLFEQSHNFRKSILTASATKNWLFQLEKTYCLCPLVFCSSGSNKGTCSIENQSFSSSEGLKVLTQNSGKTQEERNISTEEVKQTEEETNKLEISPENSESSPEEEKETLTGAREIRRRRNRSARLDITDNLRQLRRLLQSGHRRIFRCSNKKTRYTKDKYLGRRSKYIGITKNNIHWQALINVNHEKKYIGTFIDEIEAAKTYDLHAIAMQGKRARLNFSYTPEEIVSIIDHYLIHRRINLHENL